MATKRPAHSSLTAEEIEQFTDVMVSKLSLMAVNHADRPTNRDDIRQVILDTMLLIDGDVPMDAWLEGARDR